jgi:plastocyanin
MKRRFAYALPALALAAAAIALLPVSPARAAAKEYKVVEVKDGVTVRGICKLVGGDVASLPKVSIFKDNDKGCGADKERATERAIVGADNALANCVVYLKSVPAGKDWPEPMKSEDRTATIDQKGCRYIPHVQWVRTKTQLVILNNDGADHNIHGFRDSLKDTQFNFSSAPGSKNDNTEGAFLENPATYIIKCDIHPWMSAYVFGVEHPYYDITSAEAKDDKKPGEFVLENVPPGNYQIVCWHEGMKETPTMQDGKIASYSYSDPIVKTEDISCPGGKPFEKNFEIELK